MIVWGFVKFSYIDVSNYFKVWFYGLTWFEPLFLFLSIGLIWLFVYLHTFELQIFLEDVSCNISNFFIRNLSIVLAKELKIKFKFIQHIQLGHSTVILFLFNNVFKHYFSAYAYAQNESHKSSNFN